MRKFLKEPLLHFLLMGVGLFLLNGFINGPGSDDPRTIVIDRPALLSFMQYKVKTIDPARIESAFDAMDEAAKKRLINDYVREEALYREATALKFGENDYIIKKRIIQKLEMVTKGFISASSGITDSDVQKHYDKNKNDYFVEPSITFTHVFFDREKRTTEAAFAAANTELSILQGQNVPFSDAVKYGDRFLYHTNYVERTPDFVASHFNQTIANKLFHQETVANTWGGPFESPYGFHLMLVSNRQEGRYENLKDIYGRVQADAARSLLNEKSEQAIELIIAQYKVEVEIE